MDQVLKARKMSSASARRKKIQAREEEVLHAQELYIEHKRRIKLYDHLADEPTSPTSLSDSESILESRDTQHGHQGSVSSPSESSVVTPNETLSAFPESVKDNIRTSFPQKPHLQLVLPEAAVSNPSIHRSSPAPNLKASLVARADFNYDRYSMILDSPKIVTSPEEAPFTPELDFDDYSPSPVEIATPISISLPKTRPAVIQISPRSSKKRRTKTAQSPLAQEPRVQSPPPPPPPRSARRLSASSTRSGFLASEASLMQVPDLPENASSKIADASRESVAWTPSSESRIAMQRKSSQPLLSAIKTSHARMSSIKSLIKSPTHHASSSISSSRPESRSCRTPTSTADVMDDSVQAFETVPSNLYDPPRPRPLTSHRPSRPSTSSVASFQHSVTALPIVPNLPESGPRSEDSESMRGSMRRKKSFSSLRKRSESIGQAIKFAATKTMSSAGHTPKLSQQFSTQQHGIPPPPPIPQAPSLVAPLSKKSVELSAFPTPPLPSPSVSTRSWKSVGGYSMFPSTPKLGPDRKSGVGLGLGLRV